MIISLHEFSINKKFWRELSLSLILRPTISRPVCLGIKRPSGAYDQIFITVTQLRVRWCGELSLTRGRVCRLQLLLALASAFIFGTDSRRTRDNILFSQSRDFPFRRLLRLAGLRWRYSTAPPQGRVLERITYFFIRHGPHGKCRLQQFFVAAGTCLPSGWLVTIGLFIRDKSTLSSERMLHKGYGRKISVATKRNLWPWASKGLATRWIDWW
jgi:hypothetical protein